MKKEVYNTAGLLVLLFVVTVVSGCGCQRYSAPALSSPTVAARSSETVKVIWADGHQVDDKFVVHGTFRRQLQSSVPMKAHIDVQILSENGDVIQEVRSADIDLPRYRAGKGIRFERFEIELGDTLPNFATVIVTAHQGKHDT